MWYTQKLDSWTCFAILHLSSMYASWGESLDQYYFWTLISEGDAFSWMTHGVRFGTNQVRSSVWMRRFEFDFRAHEYLNAWVRVSLKITWLTKLKLELFLRKSGWNSNLSGVSNETQFHHFYRDSTNLVGHLRSKYESEKHSERSSGKFKMYR